MILEHPWKCPECEFSTLDPNRVANHTAHHELARSGADTDLIGFNKARDAADLGNARLADAIKRLEVLNIKLHYHNLEGCRLQAEYTKLEADIIKEGYEL